MLCEGVYVCYVRVYVCYVRVCKVHISKYDAVT